MPLTKFGVGQAVTRKEDDPLLRGAGRYVGRSSRPPACCMPSCCARRMRMRASASPTRRARARHAGRPPRADRRGHRASSGRCRARSALPGRRDRGAALSGPRARRGAARRRCASPSSSPRRSSRRATPPKRSRSTGSRCRTWSTPRPRSTHGAPRRCGRTGPAIVAFETTLGDAAATEAAFASAARTVSLTRRQPAPRHQLSRHPRRRRRIRCRGRIASR